MKIYLPGKVKYIIDKIYESGYEAFIVGGCVRDSILEVEPHDYDITTSAKPEKIKEIFSEYKIIDNGIKHGTISIIIEREVFEITTYRIEGEYENNRRPKNVEFTSNLVEDLKRRDFTINAMAYNDRVGLVDVFGGIDDINNKIIKTVGRPDERFIEDGLRIIRAIRFSSKLGFKIEERTLDSIYKNKKIIKNISKERITEEFTKIILSNNPEKAILLYKTKILETIGIYVPKDSYMSWIEKELYILNKCNHDIGQRLAMFEYIVTFNELKNINNINDKIKYYDEKIKPSSILNLLIYPKKVCENTDILIKGMFTEEYNYNSTIKIKKILNKIGSENFKKIINLKKMYNNCHLSVKINNSDFKNKILEDITNEIVRIEKEKECYTIKEMKIDGNVLRKLGYEGKLIGEVLNLLLEKVIEYPNLNKKEKLIDLLNNEINI